MRPLGLGQRRLPQCSCRCRRRGRRCSRQCPPPPDRSSCRRRREPSQLCRARHAVIPVATPCPFAGLGVKGRNGAYERKRGCGGPEIAQSSMRCSACGARCRARACMPLRLHDRRVHFVVSVCRVCLRGDAFAAAAEARERRAALGLGEVAACGFLVINAILSKHLLNARDSL